MLDLGEMSVVVTGGAGFLGRYVCSRLREHGCRRIGVPRSADYNLTRQTDCSRMFDDFRPDVILHLAAEVGGIGANLRAPGKLFYANAAMGLNLIEESRLRGLRKFVQVSTVCAYPKMTPVPFRESELWNGYPEETNAPYGVAKKSLGVMLDAYHRQYGLPAACVIPVNLYGPGDNFDPQSSHVIPALIRKCIEARDARAEEVICWGTGSASREFLYAKDAAEGIVRAAERLEEPEPVNLGAGTEVPIRELVTQIAELTGFQGRITWDSSRPDGQPRRCLDVSRAMELLDWRSTTELAQGLRETIEWYDHQSVRHAA